MCLQAFEINWPNSPRICYNDNMSDALKDREPHEQPSGALPVPGHDAWFKEQVEAGLKEAQEAPEKCAPMEDVFKDLDL